VRSALRPLLIVAEIGAIERFPSARHLCAWAGLTSAVRSSDSRARLGHISGLGFKPLRSALVEAAQKACQGGGPLRHDFECIAKRHGRKIAKVAIARKILTLSYYGLRDGEIRCLKPPGRTSAMKVMAPCNDRRRPLGCGPTSSLRQLGRVRSCVCPPQLRDGPPS
jgi:hypothetical protein